MIWAKRRFEFAAYAPYQDRLDTLLKASPTLYPQFIMVSIRTDNPRVDEYYIGVPAQAYMMAFDGFEIISEDQLPKEIDALQIADATTDEFTSRFRFRDRSHRR